MELHKLSRNLYSLKSSKLNGISKEQESFFPYLVGNILTANHLRFKIVCKTIREVGTFSSCCQFQTKKGFYTNPFALSCYVLFIKVCLQDFPCCISKVQLSQ